MSVHGVMCPPNVVVDDDDDDDAPQERLNNMLSHNTRYAVLLALPLLESVLLMLHLLSSCPPSPIHG